MVDAANRERITQTLSLVPMGVQKVLDVGCGDGMVSRALVEAGLDVTGVDLSRSALRYFPGKSVLAPVDRLPFGNSVFDLVICAEVLEHLSEMTYDRTLKELQRVSSRYILISTPNMEWLSSGYVKCELCQCIYHMDRHVRVFDHAAHHKLFERFNLITTKSIYNWGYWPLSAQLAWRLLGIYGYKEGLTCPCCGHIGVERPPTDILSTVLFKIIRLASRMLQFGKTRAHWIASLYERKE